MAEDRKDQTNTGSTSQSIPNRDRKRNAPVIDMKPTEVVEIKPDSETPAATPEAIVTSPASPHSSSAESGAATTSETPATAASEAEVRADRGEEAKSPKAGTEKPETETVAPKPSVAATTVPPPPPAAGRSGSGFLGLLLAGAAGAALALGGGYTLVSGRLNAGQNVEQLVAAAASRSQSETEKAIAAAEQKFRAELEKQAGTIADLGRQLAAAKDQVGKLGTELAALRETAAKPAAPAAPPVDLGPIETGLGDLEKRIANIETALSAPKTAVRATDPDVKPEAGAPPPPVTAPVAAIVPPALLAEVSNLSQRIKAIESRPQVPPVDVAPLQQRLQEIEKRLAPLAEKIGPLEEKIAPLAAATTQNRDALGGQSKDIAAGRARADAAALAVVSRSLADAVASGAPFAGLLKAAQSLGADGATAGRLAPLAEKGVPTVSALATQFEPLAAAMIENENKPAPNASFTERLTASAGKLVRVRPAEDSTEETTPALAARISAALRGGKLSDALALFDKLPPPAREKASAWASALRSRIDADEAARSILNGALARLAQP